MPPKGYKKKKVEDEVEEKDMDNNQDQEERIPDKTEKGSSKRKITKKAVESDDEEDVEEDEEEVEEDEEEEEVPKPKGRGGKKAAAKPKTSTTSTASVSTTGDEDFTTPAVSSNQIKIVSWNVAGFGACTKKGFKDYLIKEQPDIVCLQETKIAVAKVPKSEIPEGYTYHFNPCIEKTGHHGTALLTKIKPISITSGIGISKHDQEGRVVTAEFEDFYVVNAYVPNSGVDRKEPLKRLGYRTKEWDVDFFKYMSDLNTKKPVVWCGDLNVAHTEIDLANPKSNSRTAGFTIEERTSFSGHLNSGFIDTHRHFNPGKTGTYTFWSYMGGARAKNAGWRLDYFIVPATFIGSIAASFIRSKVQGSDHCPIGIIDLENPDNEADDDDEEIINFNVGIDFSQVINEQLEKTAAESDEIDEQDDLSDDDDDELDGYVRPRSELDKMDLDDDDNKRPRVETSSTTTTTTTTKEKEDDASTSTTTTTTTTDKKVTTSQTQPSTQPGGFDIENIPGLRKQRKRKPATPSNGPRLSKQVKKLAAKALGLFIEEKFEDSFTVFTEVIRLAPTYTRSYTILSRIREEQGDLKSAADFVYVGAKIGKNDPDLWKRASELARKNGDDERFIYCLRRLRYLNVDDLETQWELAIAFQQQGRLNMAYKVLQVLQKLRPDDAIVALEYAQVLLNLKKKTVAINFLEGFIEIELKRPFETIDLGCFNMLLGLYNKETQYAKTVQLFQRIRGIYPDDYEIPVDIVYNASIAFYELNDDKFGDVCMNKILQESPSAVGDLYIGLAEKLSIQGRYERALTLLLKVLGTEFDRPSIWILIGSIYKDLKQYENSIHYFENVLQYEPNNRNVTILLSDIYKELGDVQRSFQILNQYDELLYDESEETLYQHTMKWLTDKKPNHDDIFEQYKKADSYWNVGKYDAFIGIARALLKGSYEREYHIRTKTKLGYDGAPHNVRTISGRPPIQLVDIPEAEKLEENDYFNLLFNLTKTLPYKQRGAEAAGYLRYALAFISLATIHETQLKFLLVAIALTTNRPRLATVKHVKYVCAEKPKSHRIWNLFNRIIIRSKGRYYYYQKAFLQSMADRFPDSLPISIIYGNCNLILGGTTIALHEYLKSYGQYPKEPLVQLLIGITILSEIMGRRNVDRHKIALTAFSFLMSYKNARQHTERQEAFYNLARACHQIGMLEQAITLYNVVLSDDSETDPNYSLKQEAAFNLSLIYKKTNPQLANSILIKYCTI
ncbi:transcription factor IIIC-gamma subunit [Cavenderia fasciculata]|uniref:Transcription factor IIIC-gamma subunit n=1 Tax=Cavenderia fasciculata TaxID=261658 RepID=F4PZE9_CACFS|nr:transcription factor IIIC-gamma subunit [Cavenderia fasciculata]EGG19178.1 transcription factor IIIC-gamma subunit [Cavenderia fasciculata]|eukprot:XP_004366811.1 transcription factor IIIC-gamma subunit [Cavenderia fasciculata]